MIFWLVLLSGQSFWSISFTTQEWKKLFSSNEKLFRSFPRWQKLVAFKNNKVLPVTLVQLKLWYI